MKKRPREFWNTFKRKSPDEKTEISLQKFYDHFRSLASNTYTHENNDIRELHGTSMFAVKAKIIECYIIKPAQSLLMKHLVISQR